MALLPGRYRVRAHALDPEGVRLFDNVEHTFTVTGVTRELGFVRLPHRWQSSR
jgi:lipopolysaccharide transport system ATP-binding protein